jgi:hypothetical protein
LAAGRKLVLNCVNCLGNPLRLAFVLKVGWRHTSNVRAILT